MVSLARTYYYMGVLVACLLMSSCQKELCYDHHHGGQQLRVEFDWGWETPETVKGMTVLLYPEEGGSPVTLSLAGTQGGLVNVTSGRYRALCVNQDDLLQLVDTENWETAAVATTSTEVLVRAAFNNTRTAIPRGEGTEDEPVRHEPPYVYTGINENIDIRAIEGEQVIRFEPQMPLGTLYVRIENVANDEYIQTVSGAVSGLAPSMKLATQEPTESHCTMPIQLHLTDDGALEGTILYFGHCPHGEDSSHLLTVYSMMIDGSKQATTFDITEKMHASPDEDHPEVIIEEELPLPKPQPAEAGFDPSLDVWDATVIDIKM